MRWDVPISTPHPNPPGGEQKGGRTVGGSKGFARAFERVAPGSGGVAPRRAARRRRRPQRPRKRGSSGRGGLPPLAPTVGGSKGFARAFEAVAPGSGGVATRRAARRRRRPQRSRQRGSSGRGGLPPLAPRWV